VLLLGGDAMTCLLGVELHLVLGLGQEFDVIGAVNLLGDDSDLVGDGELTDTERRTQHMWIWFSPPPSQKELWLWFWFYYVK